MRILKIILGNKLLLAIIVLCFAVRVTNLTLLPIFNDESGYLDWGWRELHVPGYMFYSLYDAKQPLLMWIFAIFEIMLPDQLFAGRLVSVLIGTGTCLGLYLLTKELFNRKTAYLATLLYVFTPVFVLYDRQALMESAIASVGVWGIYFFTRYWKSNKQRYMYYLGLVLGLGFFIKSSSLVMIMTFFLICLVLILKTKEKKEWFKNAGIVISMILSVDILLFMNSMFWATWHLNSQFSLSLGELLRFPVVKWWSNISGNSEMMFFYLTPLILILSIFGMWKMREREESSDFLVISWLLIPVFVETFVSRSLGIRYLASFLPLFLVPASFVLSGVLAKSRNWGWFLLFCTLVLPVFCTFLQLFSPPQYFLSLQKVTKYADMGYINAQTSGYGVNEVVDYLKKEAKNRRISVGIAENTGNPEGAMIVNFHKTPNITAEYLDARMFNFSLDKFSCLAPQQRTYFVSRDEQQVGLDRFLQKVKTFKNPYGVNSVGVYLVKENCKGETLKLYQVLQK